MSGAKDKSGSGSQMNMMHGFAALVLVLGGYFGGSSSNTSSSYQLALSAYLLLCLIYSFGSELTFRPPTNLYETAEIGGVWLQHFGWPVGVMLLLDSCFRKLSQNNPEGSSMNTNGETVLGFLVVLLAVAVISGAVALRFAAMNLLRQNYDRTTVMLGRVNETGVSHVTTDGVYAVVRHPGFLAHILQHVSLTMVFYAVGFCDYIFSCVLTVCVSCVVFHLSGMREEEAIMEKMCDKKFKEEYLEFMKTTPDRVFPCQLFSDKQKAVRDSIMTHIRHPTFGRKVMLRLAGLLQGVPVSFVEDPLENTEGVTKIMRNADKGHMIESLLACEAWLPIRSVESTPVDESLKMKTKLQKVMAALDMPQMFDAVMSSVFTEGVVDRGAGGLSDSGRKPSTAMTRASSGLEPSSSQDLLESTDNGNNFDLSDGSTTPSQKSDDFCYREGDAAAVVRKASESAELFWTGLASDAEAIRNAVQKLDSMKEITKVKQLEAELKRERAEECHDLHVVDNVSILVLTFGIFFRALCGRRPTVAESAVAVAAVNEWRQEIAVKRPGAFWKKTLFVEVVVSAMKESTSPLQPHFKSNGGFLDLDDLHDRSALLQPFFVSPAINVCDIMCALDKFLKPEHADKGAKSSQFCEWILLETIRLAHPFPILERKLASDVEGIANKGAHVFIEFDHGCCPVAGQQQPASSVFDPNRWENGDKCPFSGIPFGSGPRKCAGKQVACAVLSPVINSLCRTRRPWFESSFKPGVGSRFSGRHNDCNGDEDSAWLIGVVLRTLKKSLWIGLGFKPNH